MLTADEAEALVNDVFEEEALVLGGMVATRDLDDGVVWDLVRNLDVIRGRALQRVREMAPGPGHRWPGGDPVMPHPAIAEFLARLGREADRSRPVLEPR